jgi:deoxyribodipyrimidine photo-lyase
MTLQIVWLKRDLRWADHAPLTAAVATGRPVVVLVLYEPSLWSQPVHSNRHACFFWESVAELQSTAPLLGLPASPLAARPLRVFYVRAEAEEAFEALARCAGMPLGGVFSHQEVGIETTFARDRRMKLWLKERGAPGSTHALSRGALEAHRNRLRGTRVPQGN